jgi:hypothetical protein
MCTNWSSARTSRRSLGSLKSTVSTDIDLLRICDLVETSPVLMKALES